MEFQAFFLLFSICFFPLFPSFSRPANCFSEFFLNKHMGASDSDDKMRTSSSSVSIDPTRVIQLSWAPRAFLYRGFLSSEECDHLINLAKDKLEKSLISAEVSGESFSSDKRTSSGMFLSKPLDEIAAGIESRIATWTFLPKENGEDLQILRYENGQKCDRHLDSFYDLDINKMRGEARVATVLMYLSDVEKGGETVFPNSKVKSSEKEDKLSDCAKNGYGVKPMKGDALLFFSHHLNVTLDKWSLHGSCPVIEGEKWSATKWIHMEPFGNVARNRDCVDENVKCPVWASMGECENNSVYMVGSKGSLGFCRKSCKVCSTNS